MISAPDDTRLEMTLRAAAHQRRNRPLGLLALAGVLLLVAGGAAIAGLGARAAAAADLSAHVAAHGQAQTLLEQFDALRQATDPGVEARAPIPFLVTRLGDLATRAGLRDKPIPPRESSAPRGTITVKEYLYPAVRADSLAPLLEWIRLATTDIAGLELVEISSLKPDPNGWTMSVKFRRWERTG